MLERYNLFLLIRRSSFDIHDWEGLSFPAVKVRERYEGMTRLADAPCSYAAVGSRYACRTPSLRVDRGSPHGLCVHGSDVTSRHTKPYRP